LPLALSSWFNDPQNQALRNFEVASKLKPTKTASNPKGAGRPGTLSEVFA
jgi:hypothetical protein